MSMRRAVDRSYLLRVWADQPGDSLRATLTPVGRQDARYQFASLGELVAYLVAGAQSERSTERTEIPDLESRLQ